MLASETFGRSAMYALRKKNFGSLRQMLEKGSPPLFLWHLHRRSLETSKGLWWKHWRNVPYPSPEANEKRELFPFLVLLSDSSKGLPMVSYVNSKEKMYLPLLQTLRKERRHSLPLPRKGWRAYQGRNISSPSVDAGERTEMLLCFLHLYWWLSAVS